MKTTSQICAAISIFFIILFIYTNVAGPIPFYVNSVTTQKTDNFKVTGEGKVVVKPDVAIANVGISANGGSVRNVQDQINSVINKVSAAIKDLGVDQKDIQTTNYNINPTYDFSSANQRITGYSASTNLSIKVRNIDEINQVLDVATNNGANQVGGISFDVDDKTKAENEARQKAVEDAKSKAESAARIAGFQLGRIIDYSENLPSQIRPMPAGGIMASAKESTPTQIETGSSEITVDVTLAYEIR